jgi:hypothetical protein
MEAPSEKNWDGLEKIGEGGDERSEKKLETSLRVPFRARFIVGVGTNSLGFPGGLAQQDG